LGYPYHFLKIKSNIFWTIRYLIIGRRAIILYGGPVLTADYDFWIHPADKKKTLSLLSDELGFELSDAPNTKKPIVSGFPGMKKFDTSTAPNRSAELTAEAPAFRTG